MYVIFSFFQQLQQQWIFIFKTSKEFMYPIMLLTIPPKHQTTKIRRFFENGLQPFNSHVATLYQ